MMGFLQQESRWNRVKALLRAAADGDSELDISGISLADMQYSTMRRYKDAEKTLDLLASLPLAVASADEYIPQVGRLKASHPVSLGVSEAS